MDNSNTNILKILQWNAKSAVSNKHSLVKCLCEYDVDIALISETWFKPGSLISFKGYNVVRNDRFDGYAGVAILIKNGYMYNELVLQNNFSSDIQMCGIELIISNDRLSFFSLYCPPNSTTIASDWENIFSQLNNTGIIGGDFNAHHNIWGSYKTNQKGHQIADILSDIDIILLNTGQPTRFSQNNNSAIDLTFSSPNLAIQCTWYTLGDTMGSDHFPIIIEIERKISRSDTDFYGPKLKWNLKKANWNLYNHTAYIFFNNNQTQIHNTESKYHHLIEGINAAADKAIAKYKISKCNKKNILPPWWDNECENVVNSRRDQLRAYKNQSTMENYLRCKQEMAKAKKTLKEKARSNWRKWRRYQRMEESHPYPVSKTRKRPQ
ncbi:unnamed protein product [Acanthoscelides obtectus]|uniref:Endonuclease/exonuclease/phosphatase domain-containing protein n=1 Tax=Acanthoscelides obtectus TaxID=200917 RepID=A0A9P0K1L5_ACAOB|nr:unnamed protein product [Acanthoscelides obtectus]CAK1648620.1 Probable RNA-directed DNA polymerase from transposon X-element [Acanthoscelides obtectus]